MPVSRLGAHHLTLPYEILMNFVMHPLTEQTPAEFQAKGIGISSLGKIRSI
jgi:hypothetical protein